MQPRVSPQILLISLPFDLLDDILSFIPRPSDLVSLAATCRAVYSLVVPYHLEYRNLLIKMPHPELWRHLIRRPGLARRIHHIKFDEETLLYGANTSGARRMRKQEIIPRTLLTSASLSRNSSSSSSSSSSSPSSSSSATAALPLRSHSRYPIASTFTHLTALRFLEWNYPFASTSVTESSDIIDIFRAINHHGALRSLKIFDSDLLPMCANLDEFEENMRTLGSKDHPLWRLSTIESLDLDCPFWLNHISPVLPLNLLKNCALNLQQLSLNLPLTLHHSFSSLHLPSLRALNLLSSTNQGAASFPPILQFLKLHTSIEELEWWPSDLDVAHIQRQLALVTVTESAAADEADGVKRPSEPFLPNLKKLKSTSEFCVSLLLSYHISNLPCPLKSIHAISTSSAMKILYSTRASQSRSPTSSDSDFDSSTNDTHDPPTFSSINELCLIWDDHDTADPQKNSLSHIARLFPNVSYMRVGIGFQAGVKMDDQVFTTTFLPGLRSFRALAHLTMDYKDLYKRFEHDDASTSIRSSTSTPTSHYADDPSSCLHLLQHFRRHCPHLRTLTSFRHRTTHHRGSLSGSGSPCSGSSALVALGLQAAASAGAGGKAGFCTTSALGSMSGSASRVGGMEWMEMRLPRALELESEGDAEGDLEFEFELEQCRWAARKMAGYPYTF